MTTAAAPEEVTLDLRGMTCASCAARIERKLNKLDGVEASVNYATERAAVSFDATQVGLEDLVHAVEAAGYGAALPRAAGDGTQAAEAERATRLLRTRLWVAAALTAPLDAAASVAEAAAGRVRDLVT